MCPCIHDTQLAEKRAFSCFDLGKEQKCPSSKGSHRRNLHVRTMVQEKEQKYPLTQLSDKAGKEREKVRSFSVWKGVFSYFLCICHVISSFGSPRMVLEVRVTQEK